jgi:leucyl/phenylalanyl-tRNA--protein transferase
MRTRRIPLPWLEPGDAFPPVEQAWGLDSDAPGLLAAGGSLDVDTLQRAYGRGIFPWFSAGQPILWWSPDPRMVLEVERFRLHRSLRKTLHRFQLDASCEIRFDSAFEQVIRACAGSPREGQNGTWIVPEMVEAYGKLYRAGYAHSVETWIDGQLVGGLYCVALGRAVFGESMFARATDASKIALAALVAFCRHHGVRMIDCQQNTRHLASLGAHEVPRVDFLRHIGRAQLEPAPRWQFDPLYWRELTTAPAEST